ncbi:VOC family protein [Staphylococcus caeli]|uniref:3-demethylubiquinone-9 3-methyltransferase n=1 Tax=Staphylococcus caeli TaxID=2201815 RepID=A0A1D4LPH2_9STAP|nr:VOC family protein [Staphylococcus caeli]SCS64516.1 3-demethylubiquinone-9 3-methyltransferase [Staphylococcus caeli]SCS88135.1 3-demethylubiquinone-9 3-methyltransferase [Staphylococcus caeli]
MKNQKIVPHLWFDTEAQQAANFYTTVFPETEILKKVTLKNTPSGDAQQLIFNIFDFRFMSIDAGPYFVKNPSISFTVLFKESEVELVEDIYHKLIENGKAIMPLNQYDFSKRYGWVQDQYDVSWQLLVTEEPIEHRIEPTLMFMNNNVGRAEEAIKFYTDTFKNSEKGGKFYYPKGLEPNETSHLAHARFKIENQWFTCMDSAYDYDYQFNEGISLLVTTEDQAELDAYWEKLSAVPEAEQCGWLKDKFGVSWQIAPKQLNEMMAKGSPEQIKRVTETFLKMKKFDIATLEKAYHGE